MATAGVALGRAAIVLTHDERRAVALAAELLRIWGENPHVPAADRVALTEAASTLRALNTRSRLAAAKPATLLGR